MGTPDIRPPNETSELDIKATPDAKPSFVEGSTELPPELRKLADLMDEQAQTDEDRRVAARAKETLVRFYEKAGNAYKEAKGTSWVFPEHIHSQMVYALPVAHTEDSSKTDRLIFSEEYQKKLLLAAGAYEYLNVPPEASIAQILDELYIRQHNQRAGHEAFSKEKWINYDSGQEGIIGQRGILSVAFVGDKQDKATTFKNNYDLAGVSFQGMSYNFYSSSGEPNGNNADGSCLEDFSLLKDFG